VRPETGKRCCSGLESQKPTPFEKTVASRDDYNVIDLTEGAAVLMEKAKDE
jgi:hypothetical protein